MSLEEAFKNKSILVTGAGRGIGREIAKRLSSYGAVVYALSRTEETLITLKEEYPTIQTICVDLLDWAATRVALKDVPHIDCLINNAGFGGMQPFLEITPEMFDEVIGINLKAAVNVSQVMVKKMIDSGKGGSIVNVTSIAGQRSLSNYAVFCASKAGLDMMTKTMAVELGTHKIKVNSVSLGCVWTPAFEKFVELFGGSGNLDEILANVKQRTPLGDPILPMDDVVNTILFVLSDLTSMMSGENVVLDGGFCAT